MKRVCPYCGKEFESIRRRQTYCSITCSAKALKRGKRGGDTEAPIDEWSLRPMLLKRESVEAGRRERLAARDLAYRESPCAAKVAVECVRTTDGRTLFVETRGQVCAGWRSCGHVSHNG